MDLYQILMQHHRRTDQIFFIIGKTTAAEARRREQLFTELRRGLEAHNIVEENIFYPELERCSATSELVGDAFDEHAEIDAILQEIAELPTDKDEWPERIAELKVVVQEHVRQEEDRIFPAARNLLDSARAKELGRRMEAMKQQLPWPAGATGSQ
ncbi:MAG: hemerythrin domain-containing protein [Alphaproteobacteria bacterium]|nr:hemerythrin domain-containing protein [Alphaproteobacteria bacterium]MBV9373562.1 hemerythrin domain-containing protein [Alphaproteobacteria bacterium]